MKILLLYTSYRQYLEFGYQAYFIEKLKRIKVSLDVLVLCNNKNISLEELSEKVKGIPAISHDVIITKKNDYGYMRGQFEVLSDFEDRFIGYDYVIHLHPDVFITDDEKLYELLNENLNNDIAFLISECFGEDSSKYSSDFFIFKPALVQYGFFTSCLKSSIPVDQGAEPVLYEQIHKGNIPYKVFDRFNNKQSHKDIDNLGIWHEHQLIRIRYYMKKKWYRHCYSLFMCILNDRRLLLRAIKRSVLAQIQGTRENTFFQYISMASVKKIDQEKIIKEKDLKHDK